MLGSFLYRAAVVRKLKTFFDYSPGRAQYPVLKENSRNMRAQGKTPADAAAAFMLIMLNSLFAPLNEEKERLFLRVAKGIRRSANQMTDDVGVVNLAVLKIASMKGASREFLEEILEAADCPPSEVSNVLRFVEFSNEAQSFEPEGAGYQRSADESHDTEPEALEFILGLVDEARETYGQNYKLRSVGEVAAFSHGLLDAALQHFSFGETETERLSYFHRYILEYLLVEAGSDEEKAMMGIALQPGRFREHVRAGASTMSAMMRDRRIPRSLH